MTPFDIAWRTITGLGVLVAAYEMWTIRRNQKLEGLLTFLNLAKEKREERRFVYRQLPNNVEDIANLSNDENEKAQKVVNFLNDLGLFLEERAIHRKSFFGMLHTTIIRLEYKLESFREYHEEQIGGRYGRRLKRLSNRAKLYHDVHPQHRKNPIKLHTGEKDIIVYKTSKQNGIKGVFQKLSWALRRLFNIY